jgi:hypothetical protein
MMFGSNCRTVLKVVGIAGTLGALCVVLILPYEVREFLRWFIRKVFP